LLAHTRRTRGFSLLEVMTAVAIIGLLAAMAVTAMAYGTGRARMDNSTFEVAALMAAGQVRATSQGVPYYAVVYQEGDTERLLLLERRDDDPLGPVDWATANLANDLADVGGIVRDRMTLGRSSASKSVTFADLELASNPIQPNPLPQPFSAISVKRGGTSSELARGCSFCVEGAGGARGVIRFNPDGTVQLLTGGTQATAGGVLAFTPDTEQQRNIITRMVVISAPSGLYRVFGTAL
jgi:prepilin-type N-terminal cleavage/methylation domain-containing protein